MARILAEDSASPIVPANTQQHPATARKSLLVSEMLVANLKFAEGYYAKGATPTKEFQNMADAVAPLNDLYGDTLADEFGPLKLKAVRENLIDRNLCRTEINKRMGRVKRVFKWAVSEELIPSGIHEPLTTVTALKFGSTSTREADEARSRTASLR